MEYVSNVIELEIIKNFFISMYTYYTSIKITNLKVNFNYKVILMILIISIISTWTKRRIDFICSILIQILFIGALYSFLKKSKIEYSLIIVAISSSITNIIYFVAITLNYIINTVLVINNFINLLIILIFYVLISHSIFKLKRLKNGIVFLTQNLKNEYFDILILNLSMIILFAFTMFVSLDKDFTVKLLFIFILFIAIMIVTIQKSLQLYYKQKMLVKDLEETKTELEEKNNRIKELEKEIIKSGKRSHSISHRQDTLEHKLEKLSMKNEISEMDIKSRIEKVGKDIRKEPVIVLAKTGIVEIDDVLDYMKSECLKKKIDFQLQLSGNIYKMINNYVSKDELEILLADHIKNAIIAIEYSENINKSILVRLGRLDGTYGLYVYDSGIEFEIETFLKLGKKPATTHKDSGGTGMGFMNTFDTLRNHNASFIIEEYGKPVTDNFTKVLKFKFDNKNEFKISTYRKEEIEKQDKEKILNVENLMF